MKKIIAVMFAIMLVIACSVTAFSGTAKVIKFESDPFTVENGTGTVDLVAENIGEVSMLQFAIEYDANKLQIENVTSEKFPNVTVNSNTPGEIIIVWEDIEPVNIDGTFATITFKAISDILCETPIGFIDGEDFIIGDSNWEEIPVDTIKIDDGVIVIDYEHDHEWNEWTVMEEATCTTAGYKESVCESYKGTCGEIGTLEIPAFGHSWSEWNVTKAETCEESGMKHRICQTCKAGEDEEIPALGHSWSEASYEWTENGKSCFALRICGNDESHIEKAGAKVTEEVVKEPTCTEMGDTEYTAVFSVEWASEQKTVKTDIPAKGHDWSEWTVTLEPTYTTEGAQYRTCKVCETVEESVIPKLPTDITISSKTLVIGGKKTVSVGITEGSEATCIQFALEYDPAVLKVNSCTAGTAVSDAAINAENEGVIYFAWESLTPINTSEIIFNIEFTTAEGAVATETVVSIDTVDEDFVFADENGKDIRNNITSGVITVIDVIYGDVTGDEKVNVLDANFVRRYSAKLISFDDNQLIAADVDGNGKVNVLDANLIRRYSAKLINVFPVEEK